MKTPGSINKEEPAKWEDFKILKHIDEVCGTPRELHKEGKHSAHPEDLRPLLPKSTTRDWIIGSKPYYFQSPFFITKNTVMLSICYSERKFINEYNKYTCNS